jgi:transposase
MGRVNTPILNDSARAELETLLKKSDNHSLRKRCQTILLKADGRYSKDVGQIVGMSHVSVNSWLSRYKSEGIAGLLTKPGRGSKPKISPQTDQAEVLALAKKHRQRLETAKAEWEASSGKSVSRDTFRRFLKVLAGDTNG